MQRKNFWYPLTWSLHEYRAQKAKRLERYVRVCSSPESCVRGGSAADWRMGRDERSPGMGTGSRSKNKEQSDSSVSGTGEAHEHYRRGESPDHGRCQWVGQKCKAGWRTSGI